MPPSITVGQHAATCLSLFSQGILLLAQTESSDDQNGLLDEFGRFKLWTSNIGVFAALHSSLDYRLRDVSDIKDSFSRQLATIENRLQQLHDAAHETLSKPLTKEDEQPNISTSTKSPTSATFMDWDNKELLQSIHQSIDWLHRLSNLVRKASFANQHKRADRFKIEDEDGNDLSDTLTNYYSKLIKRDFNGVQDRMVQRLAVSMLTRRRRIMYRISQQQRWKIQQVEPKIQSLELDTPSTKLAPIPLESNAPLKNERVTALQPEARAAAPSRLTATTVDPNISRNISAPSGISKGSTAPMNEQSKLLVPPPPKGVKFGEDFVCDYCCLILPSRIALNRNTWADHVNKDLYPYVCVVDNCDDSIEIYSSRKEWLAHMRKRHMMRWYCMAKPHTHPLEFEREDQFIEHMKIEHSGKFRDEQLPLVAENSSRPKDPLFDDCPFCTKTDANLEDHVALHLRDLALRSLPWLDDEGRSSQSGAYLHSDHSTLGMTRDTIVDSMSEPESLEPNFTENPDDDDESEHSIGDRLHLYGHFQEIANQYKPLDLREQLSDKLLAKLAMRKYQGDYPQLATLTNNLEAPQGDKHSQTEAIANFEQIVEIMQEVVNETSGRKRSISYGDFGPHRELGPSYDDIKIGIICTSLHVFRMIDWAEMMRGDIIISKSVVEYDVGDADRFILKDTLDDNLGRASRHLRDLYKSFRTKRAREILQEDTARFLKEMQAKDILRKRNRGTYRYLGTAADRLFKPAYTHKHRPVSHYGIGCSCYVTGTSCDAALEASCQRIGCDESQLVVRKSLIEKRLTEHPLTQEALKPRIHFGAIASSDSIMASGLERDKISQQEEVIAFGEGNEICEGVPYLLVNGVYDYADGHRDDLWQSWRNFATIMAGAATRAILEAYEVYQDQ
ncbi:hypothetical protein V8C42DRAFT_352759 [Trichoderma barbatum]